MNRLARATIMLCLGVVTTRLLWSGGFGWFVQQRMKWPLILAAAVLLIFGFSEAVSTMIEEQDNPESARRSKAPAVGVLLALPLMVLVSVAPTGLGAAAADRVEAFTPTETDEEFEPLDTSNGPPAIRVFEFLDRAVWDVDRSLAGTPVVLEGLVVNDPALPDGFRLTRFMVSCCAADGIPLQVHLEGVDRRFDNDDWVIVEATWIEPDVPYREAGGDIVVRARANSVTINPNPPNDPYESPY